MRDKIRQCMDDMMQRNCICNYVIVQDGNESYYSNIHALDVYMKAVKMSHSGNVDCYMAPMGRWNKSSNPVFSITEGIMTLSGHIIHGNVTEEMHEKIKRCVFDAGADAVEELIGCELEFPTDEDMVQAMDDALMQMPESAVLGYYRKYVLTRSLS